MSDTYCYLIYKRVEIAFQPYLNTKPKQRYFLEACKIDFIPENIRYLLETEIKKVCLDCSDVRVLSIEEVKEFSEAARFELFNKCQQNGPCSRDIWFAVKSFVGKMKEFSRSGLADRPQSNRKRVTTSPCGEAVQTVKAAGNEPVPDFGGGSVPTDEPEPTNEPTAKDEPTPPVATPKRNRSSLASKRCQRPRLTSAQIEQLTDEMIRLFNGEAPPKTKADTIFRLKPFAKKRRISLPTGNGLLDKRTKLGERYAIIFFVKYHTAKNSGLTDDELTGALGRHKELVDKLCRKSMS